MEEFLDESHLIGKSALPFQSEMKIKEERLPEEFLLCDETLIPEDEEEITVKVEPSLEEYPVFDIKFEEVEEAESFELSMTTGEEVDPLSLENFDTLPSTSQDQGQGQVQFLCGHCNILFFDESTLILHLSTHDNEEQKLLNCPNCSEQFTNHEVLEKHLRVHNPHRCNEDSCVKSYTTMSDLIEHLSTHVRNPPVYICKICYVQTLSKTMFEDHLLEHKRTIAPAQWNNYSADGESFECPKCDSIFTSQKDLTAHLKNVAHEKIHRCVVCTKRFYLKIELDVHVKQYHRRKRNHICETCNQSFVKKETLVRHRVIHTTGEKPFKCDKCERSYFCKYGLKTHEQSHATPLIQRLL